MTPWRDRIASREQAGGELDLPGPGAERGRAARRPRPRRSDRRRSTGGSHITPAHVVGGEQVLHGHVVLLGERLEAPRGPWPAAPPRPGHGRPRRAAAAVRRTGRPRGAARRRAACGPRAAPRPTGRRSARRRGRGSPCSPSSDGLVAGHRVGGLDDRGVRDDPARGDVAAARRSRRGSPTARVRRPGRGGRGPGACPTYGATGPAAGRGGSAVDQVLELLAGPLGLAGLLELAAERLAQLDEHLDVEGGVLQPRLRQRPRRPVDRGVLLAQAAAQRRSRPAWPARPGGSRAAGRPARCRTAWSAAARPRRGRRGPGWRRAGSTRRRRAPRRARSRSSNAIGSTSAVPAPSRRSCTR